jgi:hypothetical protein
MARPKDLGLEHTWRRRLRRQATGGQSIPAFCEREGVSTASFYAWRRRLVAPPVATLPVATPSDPPLFVPIRLDPSICPDGTPPALGFEIELPHRIRLRCAAAPDPVWLGRLVAALAGPAPREDAR